MSEWTDQTDWGDQTEDDLVLIPYHEPKAFHRSLRFITDDYERFLSKTEEFREQNDIKNCSQWQFQVDGQKVHTIYTSSQSGTPDEWSNSDEEINEYLNGIFEDREINFVLLVDTIFLSITDDIPDESMRLYKKFDLESLAEVVRNVQWRQPVPEVATQLLSEFICQHPMPNTNHRSGISILGRYLRTFDEDIELPKTGVDDEWHDWAEDYILSSKRHLTLRRKAGLLRYAHSLGVDAVQRKEGIIINLNSELENLQRPDAFQYYTQQHRNATQPFVDHLLERSDATHLRNITDDGKRAFLDRIATDYSFDEASETPAINEK
ncbi:hypothetical protein [Halocatena pleomorpha]|uniref:Uncharacterized protein n=1 Tax=Halocatena pleomorpha TaxID=1785090 RepID=A0A3P3RMI1_9EURY|nr:hypothetical protein [Halocatena pleomorpha]RRJ34049.1 hypothetical protein EIK79_00635 [Halocatena pleomorpha]